MKGEGSTMTVKYYFVRRIYYKIYRIHVVYCPNMKYKLLRY